MALAQALAHAAPQAAFLREMMASVADSQPAASAAAPGVEQTPARAPAAIRLEVALPVTASKLSEKTPVSTRRLLSAGVGLIAPSLIAPASGPFQFADVALSPQVQNPRPQDFAAQVDRLVAAREAAQPQGGLLIVAHAEFGKVELRFRRDERGLAVSLASPDPDFAQAAAAAAPATLPFNTAHFEHAEGRQAGTRGGGGPATDGSATNQSRGQQSEHRGETSGERNQHLRGMSHRSAARRSGIFA